MSAQAKLTKKQKKALAFRERKGKPKTKDFDETNAVPIVENEDNMEDQTEDNDVEAPAQMAEVHESSKPVASKKRKRTGEEGNEEKDKPEPKKKREGTEPAAEEDDAAETNTQTEKKSKQRYILFVGMSNVIRYILINLSKIWAGNLKYTTTREAIQKHFAACGMFGVQ